MADQKYLTYQEVADRLSQLIGSPVSVEWARWLGRTGRIAVTKFSRKVHRVSETALAEYIQSVTKKEDSRGSGESKAEGQG